MMRNAIYLALVVLLASLALFASSKTLSINQLRRNACQSHCQNKGTLSTRHLCFEKCLSAARANTRRQKSSLVTKKKWTNMRPLNKRWPASKPSIKRKWSITNKKKRIIARPLKRKGVILRPLKKKWSIARPLKKKWNISRAAKKKTFTNKLHKHYRRLGIAVRQGKTAKQAAIRLKIAQLRKRATSSQRVPWKPKSGVAQKTRPPVASGVKRIRPIHTPIGTARKIPRKIPIGIKKKIPVSTPRKIPVRTTRKIPVSIPRKLPIRTTRKTPISVPRKIPNRRCSLRRVCSFVRRGASAVRVCRKRKFCGSFTGCKIVKLRNGTIVKRCYRGTAVLQRACKILSQHGKIVTVCCRGSKKSIFEAKPRILCKSVRVCTASKWVCKRRRLGVCVKRTVRCLRPTVQRKCYIHVKPTKPVWNGPKHCSGVNQHLNVVRVRNVITAKCVRTPAVQLPDAVCWATGDPHYKSYAGKKFSNYGEGEFLVAKSNDGVVEVHARQVRMNGNPTESVNSAVAVKYNGGDVFTYHAKKQLFRVNGKTLSTLVGKSITLPRGGSLRRTSDSTWELHAVNGVRVVGHHFADARNVLVNLYVFAPQKLQQSFTGLCGSSAQLTRVGGLFKQVKLPSQMEVPMPKISRKTVRKARLFCKKAGLKGKLFKNCVFDYKVGGQSVAISATKELKKNEQPKNKLLRKAKKPTLRLPVGMRK